MVKFCVSFCKKTDGHLESISKILHLTIKTGWLFEYNFKTLHFTIKK